MRIAVAGRRQPSPSSEWPGRNHRVEPRDTRVVQPCQKPVRKLILFAALDPGHAATDCLDMQSTDSEFHCLGLCSLDRLLK